MTKYILSALFLIPSLAFGQIASNKLRIGDGINGDKIIEANTAAASKPQLRWDQTAGKWKECRSGSCSELSSTVSSQAISASNIDWSAGNVFTKTLSANTTFTFSNQTSGQVIVVRVTNTASNYTVTWPVSVLWSGGTAPTQTTGVKSDVYTFIYDGSTTYGSVVQNF